MDAGTVLIYQYIVSGNCQICQYLLVVVHKLSFRQKLYPLYENVDIPPLEKNVIPLRLFDEVKDKAYIKLLLFWCFIVFVNFAQHADY